MKNNFTNKISELQDFNLEPNKEVWIEIEKQLPQEKKRRIVAWWWGVPVILGLGLMVWFFAKNEKKENFLSKKEDKTNFLSQKTPENKENDNNAIVKNKNISTKNTSTLGKNRSTLDENTLISAKNTSIFIKNSPILNKNTSTLGRNRSTLDENTHISTKNTSTIDKNSSILDENAHISAKKTPTFSENNETNIIDSANYKTTKIISRLNYPKKVNWSLAFGGGINYLTKNGLFNKAEEKNYVTTASTGTVPLPQNNNLSLPNTGFNFNIGINGNYILSKKSTVQFGLHYNYLQNNIGLEHMPQNAMSLFDDLYRNGNNLTYKNTYHFVSIPIEYKYCFNPSAKSKISIIVGGSIDYAIAKKWLYINGVKDYYEKNNSELNNLFASLHTGLSFNINNKFSIDLVAKKYLNAVQKSSSKYYWQQLDMQVSIPLKLKK